MSARLTVTLLVILLCGVATANEHKLTWDRFWLDVNLENLALEVELGDTIVFLCQVNASVEQEMDLFENVVLLESEEQLNNCDIGTGENHFIGECAVTGFDNTVRITDSPGLATQPSFAAGGVYYFTSFSDGSLISAQKDITKGSSCARSPPLQLTVTVSASSPTMVVPTSTTLPPNSIKSSTEVIKSTPITPVPTILPPLSDNVVGEDSGTGHLMSLNFIILLFLAALVSCFIL